MNKYAKVKIPKITQVAQITSTQIFIQRFCVEGRRHSKFEEDDKRRDKTTNILKTISTCTQTEENTYKVETPRD